MKYGKLKTKNSLHIYCDECGNWDMDIVSREISKKFKEGEEQK